MLHIGAGEKTLPYTDTRVWTPYVLMLQIGAGVKTLSYTDIGVDTLCYTWGRGKNLVTLI
jgi:hypothetical protein